MTFFVKLDLHHELRHYRKSRKWDKNKSPVGWYAASILMRFEYYGENKRQLNRRCFAWENLVLIRAPTPQQAYRKAWALGKADEATGEMQNEAGRKGNWRFEGLTSLLPIYEKLADGAEILWSTHQNKSVRKIKALAKPKHQLEAFSKD